ncbi:hypothetical protein [Paenibacillus zanthoxyli]|uniref:hypothetical protein n=1 Tax=Paenibacillus zanthoxyli TaxID=369399 RepID=UPI00046E5AC9|nr:hypothetical protein [Paenibacillus zanthoxyli]
MKIELTTLQQFVDQFFDPEEPTRWRSYDRPQLTPRQAGEVAEWYAVKIPYAITVYRHEDVKRWDREEMPYGRPVLMIEMKMECRRGVGYD